MGNAAAYLLTQVLDHDTIWPREPRYRYRVYARVGRELSVLFAAPDAGGVGQGLITYHDDCKQAGRRLADEGQIGVLDTMPGGEPHPSGEWIVLPWDRAIS